MLIPGDRPVVELRPVESITRVAFYFVDSTRGVSGYQLFPGTGLFVSDGAKGRETGDDGLSLARLDVRIFYW